MYLIGAGGHAKVIIDILQLGGQPVDGLFVRDIIIESLMGYQVQGEHEVQQNHELIIAVGDNLTRKKIADRLSGNNFTVAVHPSAVIAKGVKPGNGTVVMGNSIINTDTKIGKHVIINTSASVDHDCIIEDFVHIAPNSTLCGGVTVGEGTLVSSGAVVIPNVSIGKWATIGAGAVVIRDVPDGAKVVGNPATVIKNRPV